MGAKSSISSDGYNQSNRGGNLECYQATVKSITSVPGRGYDQLCFPEAASLTPADKRSRTRPLSIPKVIHNTADFGLTTACNRQNRARNVVGGVGAQPERAFGHVPGIADPAHGDFRFKGFFEAGGDAAVPRHVG